MSANRLDPEATADAEQSHATKGLLRLTMACNERCPFCNVPVEDYARPTPPPEQTAAELDAFVASGQQTLTVSGGEPTLLRKRLLALVADARRRGIPFVELQTNAVLIDADYAAALADAGLTSAFVSLLSDDPALHDELAGLDGAFPRCMGGIDALLASGVRVTLNPVFARATQETVARYVDFVAARLPGVGSISLSAVQPHGRARQHLDRLLPDYDRLARSVRVARERARLHGIELLNPYCGLPLCVGWEDGLDASVEAVEAASGGFADRPGIENRGDKAHGPPCRGCALRTRCGGAWHAYWSLRAGAGLQPPVTVRLPWEEPSTVATAWQLRDGLAVDDLRDLLASDCTDLALQLPAAVLDPEGSPDRILVTALRRLDRANQLRQPQSRVHVWLRLRGAPASLQRALLLARSLGVHAVLLDDQPELVALFSRLAPELLVRAA